MVLPIPLSGPASTPELAIYKSIKADAIGKFALFAYVKDTGEHIQAMGPFRDMPTIDCSRFWESAGSIPTYQN